MLGSNLARDSDYPELTIFVVFLSPSRQVPRYPVHYAKTASFIIHPNSQSYIADVIKLWFARPRPSFRTLMWMTGKNIS